MYFDFLQDRVIYWQLEDEKSFDWKKVTDKFICTNTLSLHTIEEQEERLLAFGYSFPAELKAFWSELGCGYLCSSAEVDNGLEHPRTVLDIYFSEGNWSEVKLPCNLFCENELPFFNIKDLDYITIGLQPGVNLGKIYRFGEEIAPNLTSFIELLLKNNTYYKELAALSI